MKYNLLGQTGLKVSELCLGTMTFGENFLNIAVVDQPLANTMVAKALDSGVNFFDTADVYSYGRAEVVLGAAIKSSGVARDKVVIATKVRVAMSAPAMTGTDDFNNVGQLQDNLDASELQLSSEEVEQLSQTTAPKALYPEWMIQRQNAGRDGQTRRASAGTSNG